MEIIGCLFAWCCFVKLLKVEGVATKFKNERKEEHKKKKKKQSGIDEVIEKFIVVYALRKLQLQRKRYIMYSMSTLIHIINGYLFFWLVLICESSAG